MLPARAVPHPTLYRVHPISFRDGNGDGMGDYRGLLRALTYLNALSIDGLVVPQDMQPCEQTARRLAEQGLAVWINPQSNAGSEALQQPLLQGALAQQVVPFSSEKLVSVLAERRATLSQSVWSTGDAERPRVVSNWGQGDLRSADAFLTLLALLPAPIALYQGEELGLPHAASLQEPQGAQTPMPWHEAPEQATSGEIHWYQRVAIEHRAMAISRQQQDPDSTLRFCQTLLALRRQPVIQQGQLAEISQQNGVIRLFITQQDQCVEALINLQPYTQTATPSEATLPVAWRHGAQRESHQSAGSHRWVMPGFASAIFLQSDSHEKVVCASKGVTHG
ncbi:hypothetical protein [Yersinia entomophaga]|uniref:alpha-amylase family glycosyl hydrolase n=1 Tax=Yersinia TaxID=629 RepID=UPI000A4DF4D0